MQAIAVLLFVAGCALGHKAPDLDLWLRWAPLIVHRSLLTQGLVLPLLLFAGLGRRAGRDAPGWTPLGEADETAPARWFVMGFCLALAVHLCFDACPRGWYGYAQIYAPFYGWIGRFPSWCWLVAGALVSMSLACRLLRSVGELALCAAGLAVTYGVAAAAEPRASFFALVTLLPLAFTAFVVPRRLRLRTTRNGATLSGDLD